MQLAMAPNQQHSHFLIATLDNQGQVNPTRHLARRLTDSSVPNTRVTVAVSTAAFRRMFPSGHRDEESGGLMISYAHYSDGREDGPLTPTDFAGHELRIKEAFSSLIIDLAARERPVTCVIYPLLLPVVADASRELGIPSVLLWTQPATVFTIYHRYFHGYAGLIDAHASDPAFTVELPGLPSLTIRDLPTFLTTTRWDGSRYSFIYFVLEKLFRTLDMESNARILVNTFEELEANVLSNYVDGVEIISIGPLDEGSVASNVGGGDILQESSEGYMEWLDSKDEGSVVYVSFGSLMKLSKQQIDEISRGLQESGRPYLWVLRKDNIGGGEGELGLGLGLEGREEMGMVVEWCSQTRVLAHRSVGCFVTHCGWNSMLESLVCGMPMVMMLQRLDQLTNARLAEGEWRVGMRAELGGGEEEEEPVVEGRELRRCVDLVMEDEEMRMRAATWQNKGREAAYEGGSSSQRLKAFIEKLSTPMQPC